MTVIRAIEIENFRGVKVLVWCPSEGINCLIGPGDSGKSTVLDAIDYCIGAGSFEGGENVVESDTSTVAGINSQLISNAHNQVNAQIALFKYKRGPSEEIGSGATLDQDKVFLAGGKQTEGDKVGALRTK
jgi:predicted ATP-dependent endonuclease of OLD family